MDRSGTRLLRHFRERRNNVTYVVRRPDRNPLAEAPGAGAPDPHAPRAAPAARGKHPRRASGSLHQVVWTVGRTDRPRPAATMESAPARPPGRFHASTPPYWRVP
ncbi:hypothetical protein GCM10010294_02270 [Streptomyces griseoloalbus]|nr:hypothetical protein GCM10010294_02270 [Streptomyces griseoloalbus]